MEIPARFIFRIQPTTPTMFMKIQLSAQDVVKLILEKNVKTGEVTLCPDFTFLSLMGLLMTEMEIKNTYEQFKVA